VASECHVTVELTVEETGALLREVLGAYHAQIDEVLLTALGDVLAQWTGSRVTLIDREGHGREQLDETLDLTRTVGWFTTLYPVVLDFSRCRTPVDALKSIKEQVRRIPRQGLDYGVLRYQGGYEPIAAQLQALPQAQVVFNYLGQFDRTFDEDTLFRPAAESAGPARSPRWRRGHLLEINGGVLGDQLRMNWTYSSNIHDRATIEYLAQRFVAILRTLIRQGQAPDVSGYTPSDFAQARLNQKDLDKLLSRIRRADGRIAS
jgi:non-ribosomal peptide synthase protein (TIGR01720 family)